MAAAGGASFAPAERMVDRVHADAAVVRSLPQPAVAARLAQRSVHVVGIGDCADRREALAVNEPLLAGTQPQRNVALIAADDLGVGSGGTRDRPAPANLHFDVLDDRADGTVGERNSVA